MFISLCLACVYLLVFIYLCLFTCVYLCLFTCVYLLAFTCVVKWTKFNLHTVSPLCPTSQLFYITLHHTTSHYIALHRTTSHYIALYHTTSHYITLHRTTSHYITLHTHHVVPQSEVSGNGDAIGLFRYVEDFILSILQGGADIRPVTTTTYLMREKGGWREKKE